MLPTLGKTCSHSNPASAGNTGFVGAVGAGFGEGVAGADGEASADCGARAGSAAPLPDDGYTCRTLWEPSCAGDAVADGAFGASEPFASGVAGAGTTGLTAGGAAVGLETASVPSFSFGVSSGVLFTSAGATVRLACVGE